MSTSEKQKGVTARWPNDLGRSFTPISNYFLENYHRLSPHPSAKGLSSAEAMVIVHLLSYKWDERAPYPTLGKISARMGISKRAVRAHLKTLGDLKTPDEISYVYRERSAVGGPNRFHFDGLYSALNTLMAADLEAKTMAEMTEGSSKISQIQSKPITEEK